MKDTGTKMGSAGQRDILLFYREEEGEEGEEHGKGQQSKRCVYNSFALSRRFVNAFRTEIY